MIAYARSKIKCQFSRKKLYENPIEDLIRMNEYEKEEKMEKKRVKRDLENIYKATIFSNIKRIFRVGWLLLVSVQPTRLC